MPRQAGTFCRMEWLPVEERLASGMGLQAYWYRHAAPYAHKRSVLDVGAADGSGMNILRSFGASCADGIDPLPLRQDVKNIDVGAVPSASYDYVVACDVIEHVQNLDEEILGETFLWELLRIARSLVFFSTPNFLRFGCVNPFHAFELTPAELRALLVGLRYDLWVAGDDLAIWPCLDLQDDDAAAASNFGVLIHVPPRGGK